MVRGKTTFALIIAVCVLSAANSPLLGSVECQKLFSSAEALFAAKSYAAAETDYKKILSQTPSDLKARFKYGQALFLQQKYAESRAQFECVLQNAPNNMPAKVLLAESLIKLNRTNEARPMLEWVLKIQPEHSKAKSLLSSITKPAKEGVQACTTNSAAKAVKQACSPNSAAKAVKQASSPNGAAKAVKQAALGSKPSKQASTAAKKPQISPASANAIQAQKAEDFSLQAFINSFKHDSSFLINLELAKFYLENADFDTAKRFADAAIKLSEGVPDGKKKLEAKIISIITSVYLQDYKAFSAQLASIKPLLPKEAYESFLGVCSKGLSLSSRGERARLASGIAMSSNHFAAAERLIKIALTEFENNLLLLEMLSQAQLQNFNYAQAEQTLIKIYELEPKNPEAPFNLARFYLTVFYRPQKAKEMIECGQGLAPHDTRFNILSSLLKYTKGDIEGGTAEMQRILPKVQNKPIGEVCRQIIADGELQKKTKMTPENFTALIALPGAPHAPLSSYGMVGGSYLERESFFSAIRFFNLAKDNAEAARAYLALSYALRGTKEEESACAAADYGIRLLKKELAANPKNSKACLYAAVQCVSIQDNQGALLSVKQGLAGNADEATKKSLNNLYRSLN